MQLIMTAIWSFLISAAISYVLTSMAGEPFSLSLTFIVTSFFIVAVFILGDDVLTENEQ